MEKINITCIVCPKGCNLEVYLADGKVTEVKGHSCKRGLDYGWSESTNPRRVLTTTVRIDGARLAIIPVKSEKPLPKGLLFDCIKAINRVRIKAPVNIGDVVVENILGTGVNIVTTRSM
ncbi:MAG TPA: DUF1667 domain-containing protein [Clostridiales bacterium]|nr:DUF1667 domain-containing protein [Clostridiales bacterium]